MPQGRTWLWSFDSIKLTLRSKVDPFSKFARSNSTRSLELSHCFESSSASSSIWISWDSIFANRNGSHWRLGLSLSYLSHSPLRTPNFDSKSCLLDADSVKLKDSRAMSKSWIFFFVPPVASEYRKLGVCNANLLCATQFFTFAISSCSKRSSVTMPDWVPNPEATPSQKKWAKTELLNCGAIQLSWDSPQGKLTINRSFNWGSSDLKELSSSLNGKPKSPKFVTTIGGLISKTIQAKLPAAVCLATRSKNLSKGNCESRLNGSFIERYGSLSLLSNTHSLEWLPFEFSIRAIKQLTK